MNTDLKHGLLTDKIIGVFYDVYNELGHGFLESVYHRSLVLALESAGLKVCSRVDIAVSFRGCEVGHFEADILVENCVLLELKAARALNLSHRAQLLNYLRATDIEVGLLLNFGERPEFKRLIFENLKKNTHLIRTKSVLSASLFFAAGSGSLNSSFHPSVHG